MNFVGVSIVSVPVALCLLAGIITIVLMRRALLPNDWLFLGYLLLASTSWIILQPGHLLFHPAYALLVLAFPFALLSVPYLVHVWRREPAWPLRHSSKF